MKDFSKYSDIELHNMLTLDHSRAELAFAEIYSRYSQRIYAYLLKVMSDKEFVNDVFQDAFTKYFEKYRFSKNMTNLFGLLIKIAKHSSLNYKRSIREQVELDENIFKSNQIIEDDSDERIMIDFALKSIDEDYREIFVLRVYEDLSYDEISDITGLNQSTIRTKFLRAKDKLKNILKPYLEELK